MKPRVDPALIAFVGSETRVLTMAVLANAGRPLTGYRIAKVAGLQPIRVYEELRRAIGAGYVKRRRDGFVLTDMGIRDFLRRQVRLSWMDDLLSSERARRAARAKALPTDWFDPTRYRPDPKIAARFAGFFERPPEKDELALRTGQGLSRKRL